MYRFCCRDGSRNISGLGSKDPQVRKRKSVMRNSQDYKHYSFDLWGTLIRSNPQFRIERATYFFKYFNREGRTIDEILDILTGIDKLCNFTNEVYGGNIKAEEMYAMAANMLGHQSHTIDPKTLARAKEDLDYLFLQFCPFVYSNETIPTLTELASRGKKLSILSNTAFTNGNVLREALEKMDMLKFFDFQIFSDEHSLSKPNPKLYDILKEKADPALQPGELIHVGDSHFADYTGASEYGYDSLLINTSEVSIAALLT